ncbi:MAG: ribosomal-protein-alanine N-acetyltransferase [Bacteroidetes bacterium]|nr:MAG: ribosomal-protein-alanine N-acetyltransferase [Bacteroidota bacterium]
MNLPVFHSEQFAVFPVLETARLLLRETGEKDLPGIFRLYADERIMRYRGAPTFSSVEEAEHLLQHWSGLFSGTNGIRWTITQKENDRLIGTAGFNRFMKEHFRGEIGYELDPQLWNKGIMTEALRAIAGWGFTKAGLHSIEANIAPDNLASKRVLEKLDFAQEAHYRENYYYKGWWDSVIYSLRANEFRNM